MLLSRAEMFDRVPDEVANLVHFLGSHDGGFTTGFCFDIGDGRATY